MAWMCGTFQSGTLLSPGLEPGADPLAVPARAAPSSDSGPAARSPGSPRRVLVVEDSFMSARVLVRMVEELGIRVIGPAPSVGQAMRLLDREPCDGAILDINLGNETVEPVATRLAEAGLPFFFVSGYSSPKLMDTRFKSRRLLPKPLDPAALKQAVAEAFGAGPAAKSR